MQNNKHWSVAPAWRISRNSDQLPRKLDKSLTCHTAVIGAGITGLSAALSLSDSGKSVVVLDANQLAEGSTGWCAGILSLDTTIEFSLIESMFGQEKAKLLARRMQDSLLSYQKLVGNACDWQSGSSYCLTTKARHKKSFIEEVETRNDYGFSSKYFNGNLPAQWTGFSAAFQMQGEHSVHPVKLVIAIAQHITSAGGQIFENSAVDNWYYSGDKFILQVGQHQVIADNLICCQGMRANAKELARFASLLIPAHGHILVTAPSPQAAEAQDTGCINFWDSLQLYHYGRYLADGRILIGGEDKAGFIHGTSLTDKDAHINKLYKWAQEHHSFALPPIEHAWKASLSVPFDGMPVVNFRTLAKNNTLITAATDGLPSAMLLGEVICELVNNHESELYQLFSHERRLSLAGQLLSRVPPSSIAQKFCHSAAFTALSLWDSLP